MPEVETPEQETKTPVPGPRPATPLKVRQTFAALAYPNYRLWFMGQLASLVGTWMQSTAQGFLVFQLTQSPAYLGYVGFAAGIPTWLFMLFGGVAADRMSRRRLLVITQVSMMTLAFTLAALTFMKIVQPWHIIVMAFLLGIANAFDAPARQAFVLEMVSREVLGNAIALNSAMFNTATAVGPAIAGLTYALLGPAWCFVINGISFIAVIVALLLMKLKPFQRPAKIENALHQLGVGLNYVVHHPEIRTLIGMLGIASLFGMGFTTLIPDWAVEVLHGDATTNGLLLSARGLGSLIAALIIASLGNFNYRGKLLSVGSFVFPATLIVFAAIRWIPLSLFVMILVGWGFMTYSNLTNNLVQHHVPDELRGRVMGIYSLTFFGMIPIGALLAGTLAEYLGAPTAVTVTASVMLVAVLGMWFFFPKIRRMQ